MNKKYAFLLAFFITLFVFALFHLSSLLISEKNKKIESVVISRVIDGDTLILEDNRTIRLININSPEKNLQISNLAIGFLKSYENKSVNIEIIDIDKYNRYLARIYVPEYLNLRIVELGLASKFLVQESELKLFSNAEKNAIKNHLGIWKPSIYYNCFSTDINPKEEKIIIINNCNISMTGFTIKDESRKIYSFKNISFSKITLHSNIGKDNSTDIFWNSKTDIWNNDRDSLYLFDNNGGIAHYESYGY
ncbi:MAG: thermonuclease family protein [Candidatus Pacearchaeota archaeon]|nr:thermonuclease family protein [Candidatus Pacearchaeota archaeon]